MPLHIKQNGTYKEMTDIAVKVSGEWKNGLEVLVKRNGVWERVWEKLTVYESTSANTVTYNIDLEGYIYGNPISLTNAVSRGYQNGVLKAETYYNGTRVNEMPLSTANTGNVLNLVGGGTLGYVNVRVYSTYLSLRMNIGTGATDDIDTLTFSFARIKF